MHLCKTETGRPPEPALSAQSTTSGFWGVSPYFYYPGPGCHSSCCSLRRSKPELRLKCQSMADLHSRAQQPDCFHGQAGSNQNPNSSPFPLPRAPHCSALLPTTASHSSALLRLLSALNQTGNPNDGGYFCVYHPAPQHLSLGT